MFRFEADNTVFIEDQKTLEAALSTNPKTQTALRALVRQCILEARREVAMSIKFANGDPRNTRQAVRSTVYRKVFGGNLNILNSKKKHEDDGHEVLHHQRPYDVGGEFLAFKF